MAFVSFSNDVANPIDEATSALAASIEAADSAARRLMHREHRTNHSKNDAESTPSPTWSKDAERVEWSRRDLLQHAGVARGTITLNTRLAGASAVGASSDDATAEAAVIASNLNGQAVHSS